MGIPSESPGFKKLLEDWYKILKESGFEDIEVLGDSQSFIKRSGTHARMEQMTASEIQSRTEYFEQLKNFISHTVFDSSEEKAILTLYADGYTQTEIRKQIPRDRSTIYKKLYKWLKIWKLK